MSTKVIFRKFPEDGSIIALFPELPGTSDPNSCMSYMHVGQHSPAQPRRLGIPATPQEYGPLKAELESLGYVLEVVKRFRNSHRLSRKALIANVNS